MGIFAFFPNFLKIFSYNLTPKKESFLLLMFEYIIHRAPQILIKTANEMCHLLLLEREESRGKCLRQDILFVISSFSFSFSITASFSFSITSSSSSIPRLGSFCLGRQLGPCIIEPNAEDKVGDCEIPLLRRTYCTVLNIHHSLKSPIYPPCQGAVSKNQTCKKIFFSSSDLVAVNNGNLSHGICPMYNC